MSKRQGQWLRDAGGSEDRDELDRRYGEWLDAFDAMDAEGVGFGWVVLHKGGTYGAQGPRIEDVSHAPRLPDGAEVAALVAARSAWADVDAFALLESRPWRSEGLRLAEEDLADARGRLAAVPPRLALLDGWRPDVLLDSVGAHLVRSFDGATTVSTAIDGAATVHDLDPDDVLPGALIAVRGLIEVGLLHL